MRWTVLFLFLFFTGGNLSSQVKAPFLPRYQASVKGNMTLIANNMVSATATGNYNGTLGNHSVVMVYVDVDSDTSTFNSSNATLALPSGLVCPVMKKTYLYWAAADMEDPGNEPNWEFNKVKLKVPGDTLYTTVTADQVIYQGRLEHFYNDPYVCVKDITAMVAGDPTGTYWVANVKGKQGTLISHGGGNTGCSGGWIIVVVYESTSLPQKNIAIFDGYVHVATEMSPNPLPFSFSGFQTVPTGDVNVDFLMGSLEGDWDLTGDYCEIQKVDASWLTMSSPLRQTNNFFHSIIGLDGAQFLNRVPASQNTLGFDADKFPIPNTGNMVIGNSQTSATIRMGTNQEIYGMFLVGLAVDVWFPEILSLFTIPAMPGGTGDSVNAGDTVTFHLQARNNGNDGAQGLVLSTVIPPGLVFLQVINPLPPGVTSGYNAVTKTLSFSIPDSLVEVGDSAFSLDYKARAITDCILLQDSAVRHPTCQVTASYQGVVNATPQVNVSSTGLTLCGLGNLQPVTLTIIPGPAYPVAVNDSATIMEDTQATINVLANDTDCDNNINPGNLSIIAAPVHGNAMVVLNTGNITYTPALNYYGKDTLRYRICDYTNLCDTASVFLNVLPVNDPPVVMNESFTLCENSSVSGNILENDYDPVENTAMSVVVPAISGPLHGNIVLGTNGIFTYTPLTGYSGSDQFVVSVCDGGYPLPPICFNDTIFITVTELIIADAGADQVVCNATTITLTGNSPFPGTGVWQQVSGPDTAIITPTGASAATASGLIPGLYEFSYTITSGECISSDSVRVDNLSPAGPANAGSDQELCVESSGFASTTLSAIPPLNGSGLWSQVAGPAPAVFGNPNDPHSTVSGLILGEYLCVWTVTNGICPSLSDSVFLRVSGPGMADAGVDRLTCGTEPVVLDGSTAAGYASLLWNTTGDGIFSDATVLNPSYTPGSGDISKGTAVLKLTAVSFSVCPPISDSMTLIISKPPVADAGPDGVTCTTIPFTLSGANASWADSLSWSHNGNGQLAGASTLFPVYTPSAGEQGTVTFTLHVFGTAGCAGSQATDQMNLEIYLPVSVEAGPDQSVGYGTVASLNSDASLGSGDYSYSWEPHEMLVNGIIPNPQTLPLDTTMTFIVTVTDNLSGCSGSDSVRISVVREPVPSEESCIHIHNVITPNKDGKNDTWIIDCIGNFPENKMVIFDRWGDRIREITNYDNRSNVWDGTNQQGDIVPDGTYYYVLAIKDGGTYTGWVFVRGGSP
ncbi:MAG: Ig-like domain-containing protein [Bacteroidetes bacterium]|nr:Ig-like domain-containing protein [Bacteroidota bacterium]